MCLKGKQVYLSNTLPKLSSTSCPTCLSWQMYSCFPKKSTCSDLSEAILPYFKSNWKQYCNFAMHKQGWLILNHLIQAIKIKKIKCSFVWFIWHIYLAFLKATSLYNKHKLKPTKILLIIASVRSQILSHLTAKMTCELKSLTLVDSEVRTIWMPQVWMCRLA